MLFLTNNQVFPVANIGVSLLKTMSLAQCDLGAGKCTSCPSRSNKKSCHCIMEGDRLKSFKKIISAFSAPTHAKLIDAGFENELYITFNGFSRKVFPQLAMSTINNMFLYFPRPFCNSSLMLQQKYCSSMPFRCKISHAQVNHCPLQFSMHSPCLALLSSSSSFPCPFKMLVRFLHFPCSD